MKFEKDKKYEITINYRSFVDNIIIRYVQFVNISINNLDNGVGNLVKFIDLERNIILDLSEPYIISKRELTTEEQFMML